MKFTREGVLVQSVGHVMQAAADAIKIKARKRNRDRNVVLLFNDLALRITAESTPESVAADYDRIRLMFHFGAPCRGSR